jgi:galactokinase
MGGIFVLFYRGHFPLQGKDIAERGQFGDSFGVLNSLFTGLGFGGLIVTLLVQQKQLRQQEQQIRVQQQSEQT